MQLEITSLCKYLNSENYKINIIQDYHEKYLEFFNFLGGGK